MAKILILHGPNLNLLGEREPKHYGRVTLAEIDDLLANMARHGGHDTEHLQSNAEDALVERIVRLRLPKRGARNRHAHRRADWALGTAADLIQAHHESIDVRGPLPTRMSMPFHQSGRRFPGDYHHSNRRPAYP